MKICSCNCTDNHSEENNDILKSASLKVTPKRVMMINCLRHSDKPLSAEEIHSILNKEIEINLSTVYRALNALEESEIIIKQTLSDGNSVFQLNTLEHKHILSCKVCGMISYIDICPVNEIKEKIEEDTGYTIIGHNLEFVGICVDCKKIKDKD